MKTANNDKNEPFLSFWNSPSSSFSTAKSGELDQYKWPSMFDESKEMLDTAVLIYTFADIRALIREGVLTTSEENLLSLPVGPSEIMKVVQNNMDKLREYIDDVDQYLSALESVRDSLRRQEVNAKTGEVVFHSSLVVEFDDENSDHELVYGIGVNSARKRITVAFRGSVTAQDFMTDVNALLTEVPNPVVSGGAGIPQNDLIGIHHGFRNYLFGSRRLQRGWSSDEEKCKYDKIMDQVLKLFVKFPDYKLYVTGHSLGGALATLFAFEGAADYKLPKPITCISVASPKVGNLWFLHAFQALERQNQIRCLRIANNKDLVTLLPDRGALSCMYLTCFQSHVYRHVGFELKLFKRGKFGISRSSDTKGYLGILMDDLQRHFGGILWMLYEIPFVVMKQDDLLEYHSCNEYMERLYSVKDHMKRVSLNRLYRKARKEELPV